MDCEPDKAAGSNKFPVTPGPTKDVKVPPAGDPVTRVVKSMAAAD